MIKGEQEMIQFIHKSKRLLSAVRQYYHIRYVRKGHEREFYLVIEKEFEVHFLDKKKRSKAYDIRQLKKLNKKIEREYGERAKIY